MKTGLLANMGWLGVGNLAVKPIWFVFITYVCVVELGLAQYGLMTASLALMGIAVGISNLGTSQYTVREVARDKGVAEQLLSNILPLRVVLAIVAVAVFLVPSIVNSSADLITFVAAGGYAAVTGVLEYERSFFRAYERLRDESATVVAEKIAVVGGGTIAIWLEPTARAVLMGMCIGATLVAVGSLVWIGLRYAKFRPSTFSSAFVRQTIAKSYPLGLAGVFILLYFRVDSVMLKYMTSDTVVGEYGLAYRVLEALIILPGVAVAVLLPRLSAQHGQGEHDDLSSLVVRSSGILFSIAIGLAVVIGLFATPIITLLAGEPTVAGIDALRILVWAFPFAAVASVLSSSLISMDDQVMLAVLLGLSAAINIILNLVLIPRFSLLGACAATVATELMVSTLMFARYKRVMTRNTPARND